MSSKKVDPKKAAEEAKKKQLEDAKKPKTGAFVTQNPAEPHLVTDEENKLQDEK